MYYYNPRLKGKHKKFDQDLHDMYDKPAREAVKKQLGDFVKDHPDAKKQDLVVTKPCKYRYIEVQVCGAWQRPEYPYRNPIVYERKGRYGKHTLYITMNKLLTRCIIFDRQSLSKKPRRLEKWSREFVYDIPWNKVLQTPIELLTVEDITQF